MPSPIASLPVPRGSRSLRTGKRLARSRDYPSFTPFMRISPSGVATYPVMLFLNATM